SLPSRPRTRPGPLPGVFVSPGGPALPSQRCGTGRCAEGRAARETPDRLLPLLRTEKGLGQLRHDLFDVLELPLVHTSGEVFEPADRRTRLVDQLVDAAALL